MVWRNRPAGGASRRTIMQRKSPEESRRAIAALNQPASSAPKRPSSGSRPRAVGPEPTAVRRSTWPEAFPRVAPRIRHRRLNSRDAHMIGAAFRIIPGDARSVSTGAGGHVDGSSRPRTSDVTRSVARARADQTQDDLSLRRRLFSQRSRKRPRTGCPPAVAAPAGRTGTPSNACIPAAS